MILTLLLIAEVNNILDLDRKFDVVVNANVKHVKCSEIMLDPIKRKNQSDFCKTIEILYTTINLSVLVCPKHQRRLPFLHLKKNSVY